MFRQQPDQCRPTYVPKYLEHFAARHVVVDTYVCPKMLAVGMNVHDNVGQARRPTIRPARCQKPREAGFRPISGRFGRSMARANCDAVRLGLKQRLRPTYSSRELYVSTSSSKSLGLLRQTSCSMVFRSICSLDLVH